MQTQDAAVAAMTSSAAKLADTNVDELLDRRAKDLGSLNFDAVRTTLKRSVAIASELLAVEGTEISLNTLQAVNPALAAVNGALVEVALFAIGEPNSAQLHQGIVSQLEGNAQTLMFFAYPAIAYLRSRQMQSDRANFGADFAAQMKVKLADAEALRHEIVEKDRESSELLANLQDIVLKAKGASSEIGVSLYEGDFAKTAKDHEFWATAWLIITMLVAAIGTAFAWYSVQDAPLSNDATASASRATSSRV